MDEIRKGAIASEGAIGKFYEFVVLCHPGESAKNSLDTGSSKRYHPPKALMSSKDR